VEPSLDGAIISGHMEIQMARHISRARLTRSVAGAFSAMVVCATAAFLIAYHLARF
jgi:ABC-type spermidine/putrescine transport system permease subunit I